MMIVTNQHAKTFWGLKLLAIVLGIVGLPLLLGGLYLITLGGSLYYALAGAGLIASAVLMFRGEMRGIWIFLTVFAATVVWALFEVGLDFWAIEARIVAPLFLAGIALLLVRKIGFGKGRPANVGPFTLAGIALIAAFFAFLVGMFFPHGVISNNIASTSGIASDQTIAAGDNWSAYGRTGAGTRYSPADQITLANIGKLEKAWVVHSGDVAVGTEGKEEQNTPLYVDGTVFHCSPMNKVTAINGSTGVVKWTFDPKSKFAFWKRCRSLGYFDTTAGSEAGMGVAQNSASAASIPAPVSDSLSNDCNRRIFVATLDAKLIAVSAATGTLCTSFGDNGTVDLNVGMGETPPGFYVPTTGPIVAGDKILVGGWIGDNYSVGEPSGVVRAFDAHTGNLIWAWDLANPGNSGLPPAGESYTRGTPNDWAPIAFDTKLGMAYLPLGNATPDYYGGKRRPFDDEYNSSVVAVDLATGKERWHFRTVNHDIWDYDVPAQPALVEFPDGKGGTNPGLIQTTKRGEIFVLDRRTGTPLVQVEQRPVAKGDGTSIGEYYAPTQPFSTGMASIGTEPLSESRMWGMTPIDQMICRIQFRQHYYTGPFTAQSLNKTLVYPGNNGGPNWGSATVDETRNILVVADMRMPVSSWLIPRKDIPSQDKYKPEPHGKMSPQFGLPFGQNVENFMSPLGVPCLQPPIGTISAIDLGTRKLLWQRPAGTMKDVSIGMWQPRVPFYVGMPALGGAITTKSGLTFHAGTQDYYLRAYNTKTGDIVWEGRLPSGAQSTPMTYFDKESGRQFVVVTAGGARYNNNDRGDWIIAYALPKDIP